MLENVNGNKVLSCVHVPELFKTFRQGCEDLVNNPNSKRQSSAQNPGTVAKVHELLTTDCWMALKLMRDHCMLNSKQSVRFFIEILVRGNVWNLLHTFSWMSKRSTQLQYDFVQISGAQPFIWFTWPQTSHKGENSKRRRCQDVKDIKKNVRT